MEIIIFILGLIIGSLATWYTIISNYNLLDNVISDKPENPQNLEEKFVSDDFNEEEGHNINTYYVSFPHHPRPIEISIEEELQLNHYLMYREKLYVVSHVIHKEDKHTLFVVKLAEKNGN